MCVKVLVIGLGNVGRAIFELLRESGRFDVYGYDLDEEKTRWTGKAEIPPHVHVMHVCYQCETYREFLKATVNYMSKFEPKLTIIESTVPPGTTLKIYETAKRPIVHSPVRGIHLSHENMKQELRSWTKYVGGVDSESASLAKTHFEEIGLRVAILKSPFETELAKLFETTYRALMIAWFQEMHRISRYFDADFDQVVSFLEDTHRVRLDRPILFPSVIGGQCLIPNAKLLLKAYDSEFVELILKSNERRDKEIRDTKIQAEVDKIKRRVERLSKELRLEKAPFNPTI